MAGETVRMSLSGRKLKSVVPILLSVATFASGTANAAGPKAFASSPYMGWTTWNLEDIHRDEYTITWLNAEHTREQADILHKVLQPYGYNYVNVDSGWCGGFDGYGRPITDLKRFPGGMEALAKYVHHYGQKLGIYWIPGIQHSQYDANPPIYGTHYHIRDIVATPFAAGNAFGDWHMKIDFKKPGAQEYIDSVVKLWASWGVDYLKIDGVGPGSDSNIDSRDDIVAYSNAIKKCGRPIWLELSWRLDPRYADFWEKYANGRRCNDDVDSLTRNISGWGQVQLRFAEAPAWTGHAGPGKGWNDFDAAPIGSGEMDGLTDDERRTVMSFWAIECAPIFIGDDLNKLDALGIELLTNREVIAIDQAGRPAEQMVGGSQQVWRADNGDGTITVDLVNLSGETAMATANLDYLGYHGMQPIHDLWTHKDLGAYQGMYTTVLAPHASRLIRIGAPSSRRAPSVASIHNASLQHGAGGNVPAVPAELNAVTGDASVALSWRPSTSASAYVVWRSLSSHSGYAMVDSNVHRSSYLDRSVVDGTPYYYQVTAVGAGGESARSAPVGVLPEGLGHSNVIGVDFDGGADPLDIDDAAGAVPAMHWNNGFARTGDLSLVDGSGNASGAYLQFVAGGTYVTSIPDDNGDDRMMRGYLETYGHDTTTITVTSLPAWFTQRGYDVYVYCDGGNGNSTRVSKFTIGSQSIICTDAAGADFHGQYLRATAANPSAAANYVEFEGLTGSSFTVGATPVSSTDEYLRAPVNGLQIVAH